MKPIIDQAFETYKYFPENYQENGEKVNMLLNDINLFNQYKIPKL